MGDQNYTNTYNPTYLMPLNLFYSEDFPIWIGGHQVNTPQAYLETRSNVSGSMLVRRGASYVMSKLAISFAVVGILILVISYGPSAVFAAKSALVKKESSLDLTQKEVGDLNSTITITRSSYQPPVNPKLPKSNRLVIPALGVSTNIEEASLESHEAALRKGVWRASDFGAPTANSMPTILAAHRFGYVSWSNSYRHYNSFYNLPKLKVGDVVEIDWQQRKFMYEVYAESTGTEITDYTADLVLYTCTDLSSPERVFKYGRLMEI